MQMKCTALSAHICCASTSACRSSLDCYLGDVCVCLLVCPCMVHACTCMRKSVNITLSRLFIENLTVCVCVGGSSRGLTPTTRLRIGSTPKATGIGPTPSSPIFTDLQHALHLCSQRHPNLSVSLSLSLCLSPSPSLLFPWTTPARTVDGVTLLQKFHGRGERNVLIDGMEPALRWTICPQQDQWLSSLAE